MYLLTFLTRTEISQKERDFGILPEANCFFTNELLGAEKL